MSSEIEKVTRRTKPIAAGAYLLIRCLGQKSRKLVPGEVIKIGRHESNDMVLAHGTVSRFHAKLVWDMDEDRPYVQDLGSANGVEVDGIDVEGRCYLPGGNQVGIGDFTLIMELRGTTTRFNRPTPSAAVLESKEDAGMVRLFSEKGGEFKGDFEDKAGLQRTLLKLEDDARTGTLRVVCGTKLYLVTFSQGLVVTVVHDKQSGEEMLKTMLGETKGAYRFSRDLEPSEECLNISCRVYFKQEAGDTYRVD